MPDKSFDAIIIGGGNKGLVTACYLAKYGGMSVGIFEETWELGGGLSTTELPPGFNCNTHGSNVMEEYYLCLLRDFPDIKEKGLQFSGDKMAIGIITEEDQKCWGQYRLKDDLEGEKTAAALEKFSGQKDADTYLKLWQLAKPGGPYYEAFLKDQFSLPNPIGVPSEIDRVLMDWIKTADAKSLGVDEQWLNFSAWQAAQELWDEGAVIYMAIRLLKSSGFDSNVAGARGLLYSMLHGVGLVHINGGTHNLAHAMQRIISSNGGTFFSHSEVKEIIIENGTAGGVRLADGTEIEAKKLIVSNVSPYQLCFDLIGPDYLNDKIRRRIKNLVRNNTCITWYTFAVHELPKYNAAAEFNPDVNDVQWLILGKHDPSFMASEQYWRYLGLEAPQMASVVCGAHSREDPTMVPEGKGKHIVSIEDHVPDATCMTEREWIKFKNEYAEKCLIEWQKYAPNMTWDNVIDYISITPYDTARRHKNFWPTGDQNVIDRVLGQTPPFNPMPEMAWHRVADIKQLYATGSAWGRTPNASAGQGYTCYKAIAEDMGLAKPWEGNPW